MGLKIMFNVGGQLAIKNREDVKETRRKILRCFYNTLRQIARDNENNQGLRICVRQGRIVSTLMGFTSHLSLMNITQLYVK